jgi:hypothetical protein
LTSASHKLISAKTFKNVRFCTEKLKFLPSVVAIQVLLEEMSKNEKNKDTTFMKLEANVSNSGSSHEDSNVESILTKDSK